MANMFSNKTDKRIPKTLNDCIVPDATVANLHFWAERLENWGNFLFRALIVIGIISTIMEAVAAGDIDEALIFPTILTSAASWALYAFIEYCAYHVLALLISALASITQNTIISANVALLEASQHHKSTEPEKDTLPEKDALLLANGGWKCSCGRVNASYVSTCACQRSRNEIAARLHQKKCWACDTVQSAKNEICVKCGERL